MKKTFFYLLVMSIIFTSASCSQSGAQKVKLETSIDSVSYAIGVLFGASNKEQLKNVPAGDEINTEIMAAAFTLATTDGEVLFSDEEANMMVNDFFQKESKKIAQKNLEEGNAFLEKNKTREGVITTESGLQYEIITEGTGAKPTEEDQVEVHYHGTNIDGTIFDSSVERGEPVTFGVTQVIPGWTEALQLMPAGSKWKVYIPANLAYGEQSPSPDIKPNSVLIFEVELLNIVE
ncbi:MAG: FKBP-type peptidyl-prolyl cis-trans isomerase [Prolixibacteraceae bacterium]|nr:FKBP-type peptidyl-prolyl cis-trans isomerase [Prolixibacteraceae bacterium]